MSARCALCGLPVDFGVMDAVRVIPMSGQDRVLCLQCLDDAEARKPRPPVAVDPAGPASAAARAVAALEAIPAGDPYGAHSQADGTLTKFLREAGFAAVADAYRAAEERTSRGGEWWYA